MNNNLKLLYILTLYFQMYYGGLIYFTDKDLHLYIYFVISLFFDVILILLLYKEIKNIKKNIVMFLELLIMSIMLFLFSSIVQFFTWLTDFPYNNKGKYYYFYRLFIFSLHYPIYIFIFIKPFVNHLDKSIKKFKEKELNKDE
ncbi:hypothetical protein CSPARA_0990 [Campylobacter sputorum bv. paraureolyticus LMG 11764]|nr:hypothetical protein CSPARA_0990 [Campylobacter sputorum bv. paraureolyticus LMG 11764]